MADDPSVTRRRAALALWVVLLGLVIILIAFVGAARATDASAFCKSCHEMVPYYDAWKAGPHAENAQCVDCHVNAGFFPRMAHKVVALGEVYNHFLGNTLFPLPEPPVVPNARCEGCHPSVKVNRPNFSHQLHAEKAACQQCHYNTGHDVTVDALKAVGAFNPSVEVTRAAFPLAAVGAGKANIPGHVTVVCSRCHDMAKTGCPACHTQPADHPKQGVGKNCALCHAAGAKFVFRHPSANLKCAECHKAPAIHPKNAQNVACEVCHRRPGKSWKFTHPARGADCSQCHQPPADHPAFANGKPCASCHQKAGASWAWNHPGLNSACQTCHQPPANHSKPPCTSCHRSPGATWAFSHPSAGEHSWQSMPCTKCHPSGPPRVYCTCHKGNPPSD